jgi:6,7-dimethyl-8-ribityllumazine synthase
MAGHLEERPLTVPPHARFGIVAARWNATIVDRLLQGALAMLKKHGVPEEDIRVVRVPGSVEIPVAVRALVHGGAGYATPVDAVIALGCVIRGETAHFDFVAGEAARGCGQVALSSGVPVIFGVLTTENEAQALARAGGKDGHKGEEAALSAIEMVGVMRSLRP